MKCVAVDTTVMEKAIAYPTDARLYERARTALSRARRDNHWPAYQSGEAIEPIDLPRWAVS